MRVTVWVPLGAAHPRSRGENRQVASQSVLRPGSSPLTRGKLLIELTITSACGLIPAHAGKTSLVPMNSRSLPAHPRSRGENPVTSPPSRRRTGSSPLTRGKLAPGESEPHPRRLIPAHAGKTQGVRASLRR